MSMTNLEIAKKVYKDIEKIIDESYEKYDAVCAVSNKIFVNSEMYLTQNFYEDTDN